MPRGDQLSRQWRLIQLIDRPQGITVGDAATDLAVTMRTVWRDLDVPQKAGFPPYTKRAVDGNLGVWRVTDEFRRALPTGHLTTRSSGRVSRAVERERLTLRETGLEREQYSVRRELTLWLRTKLKRATS